MKRQNKQVVLSKRSEQLYEKRCMTKAEKIIHNKKKISKIISKARKIFERLHNIPRCNELSQNICDFCDLLTDYLDGIYDRLPLATIITVLAGLIYFINPFDPLPDFIPVIGWLDDAAIVAFIVAAEKNDIKEYLEWKNAQATIVA